MLKESDQTTGTCHLVSPTGVKVVVFSFSMGSSMPMIHSLVKDLDCGENHRTIEHAIKHIANRYERMNTTMWERVWRSISKFLSHSGWRAVAAVAAITGAVAACNQGHRRNSDIYERDGVIGNLVTVTYDSTTKTGETQGANHRLTPWAEPISS